MSRSWRDLVRLAALIAGVAGILTMIPIVQPSRPVSVSSVAPVPPKALLDFILKDVNGNDVGLDSFKGKVILVNFWATWCAPCRAEIPGLIELQRAYPDDLVVLGVVVMDRFGDNVRGFTKEVRMNYPVLDGTSRTDVEQAYAPMWGLPTTVIIGRNGKFAKRRSGIGSKEQFEQDVRALL